HSVLERLGKCTRIESVCPAGAKPEGLRPTRWNHNRAIGRPAVDNDGRVRFGRRGCIILSPEKIRAQCERRNDDKSGGFHNLNGTPKNRPGKHNSVQAIISPPTAPTSPDTAPPAP